MTPVRPAPEMTPTDMARNLLLLRASEALSATVTTADVVDAVLELGRTGLDASHLRVTLLGDRADRLTERTIHERRAFYFADGGELAAAFPSEAASDMQATVCVPLVGVSGVLGTLRLLWDVPRTFYVAERAVIATLAAYIAQALERAQRLDALIGVAHVLQEAIVSRLPTVEGYELAAHYLPADRQEKVGGDWYDAVAGRNGRLTLVIGDVVGHDMAAAARMGQLRSMLRAYIVDRHEPPSALLHRLDAANHSLGEPIIATAVVAVLDTLGGGYRLRWSNAGHPPPVVIRPDGTVHELTGNDVLIGARRFAPRHTWTVPLARGSTVLLHTDGLVERPDGAVDEDGSDHLHRCLRTNRRTRLQDLLEDAVVGAARTDDIAVLAVRVPAGGPSSIR